MAVQNTAANAQSRAMRGFWTAERKEELRKLATEIAKEAGSTVPDYPNAMKKMFAEESVRDDIRTAFQSELTTPATEPDPKELTEVLKESIDRVEAGKHAQQES
jgi:hypothetical protein